MEKQKNVQLKSTRNLTVRSNVFYFDMRYDQGPLGALMDEYERAAAEYVLVIASVPTNEFEALLNPITENKHLRTIQGICFHVLFAGYSYANAIRTKFGMPLASPAHFQPIQLGFPEAMNAMLAYTEESVRDRYSMTDDEISETNIPIQWSDHHDFEALLEHAIVHILRHRRQVERLLERAD